MITRFSACRARAGALIRVGGGKSSRGIGGLYLELASVDSALISHSAERGRGGCRPAEGGVATAGNRKRREDRAARAACGIKGNCRTKRILNLELGSDSLRRRRASASDCEETGGNDAGTNFRYRLEHLHDFDFPSLRLQVTLCGLLNETLFSDFSACACISLIVLCGRQPWADAKARAFPDSRAH